MENRKKLLEVLLIIGALLLLAAVLILFAHPAVAESQRFFVTENVRERTGPSTDDPVVLTRTAGEEVEVISIANGWAKLKDGNYVYAKYLSSNPSGLFRKRTMWVVVSSANVRSEPSKNSQIIDSREFGVQVTVTAREGEWYSIKGGGYIHYSCLYANIENYFRSLYDDVILISISQQHISYYISDSLITSGSIVSGKDSSPTPLGNWTVLSRVTNTKMSGKKVDYAVYFVPGRGIAVHNAPWRTHFGGTRYKKSGSMGCVNTTYDIAQLIYESCRVKTTRVVVYQ